MIVPRPRVVDVKSVALILPVPVPTATPFKYKTPPVKTKFPNEVLLVSRNNMEESWMLLVYNCVKVERKVER